MPAPGEANGGASLAFGLGWADHRAYVRPGTGCGSWPPWDERGRGQASANATPTNARFMLIRQVLRRSMTDYYSCDFFLSPGRVQTCFVLTVHYWWLFWQSWSYVKNLINLLSYICARLLWSDVFRNVLSGGCGCVLSWGSAYKHIWNCLIKALFEMPMILHAQWLCSATWQDKEGGSERKQDRILDK